MRAQRGAATQTHQDPCPEALELFGLPPDADTIDFRLADQVAIAFAAGRLAERYKVLPFDRDVLMESFQAVWANIHQQAVKGLQRDPVREFIRKLSASQERLVDLDRGPPTLTKSDAKQALFKKTQKDGRVAIFLTTDAFARLAPQAQPVLHWLHDRGFLQRESKARIEEGTTNKRQTNVVVAYKPNGSPIRLRVYKLVGDMAEMRRAAGGAQSTGSK